MYHKPIIASDLTTSRSKELRSESTPPERILWKHLHGNQVAGLKFRRPHPIGPYIADFCCVELSLVVEIDGSLHVRDRAREDDQRDLWLAERGFRVLRFTARAVFSNAADVVRRIEEEAVRPSSKSPSVRCADTSPVGDGGGH